MGGLGIAVDSCSGSVHILDDAAYETVSRFGTAPRDALIRELSAAGYGTADELSHCYDEVASLKADGKLFSPDRFGDLADRETDGAVKALCLHVAHTCNLSCEYCFAGGGKYHGPRSVMSYETGERALDFLVERSGSRRNLEVDFFGGEPLMNFGVVKRLVAYARGLEKTTGKVFRFTLTTNGVLLDDEVTDFCNREMSNVVLSLDGRRETHDRFRVDLAGRGSYDRVVPRFQRFVERRGGREYYIRGTFTRYNTDFSEDIKAMLDLGFTRLSMEPVVADKGDPAALTEEDLPTLFRQYEELAGLMKRRRDAGRPFLFYHYMLDLEHGPCIYKRVSGCGSGSEYLAVTPEGDLYPCHQFVGDKAFLMGNIAEGVTRPDIRGDFSRRSVYRAPECRDCWAKFYCAGGCAANSYRSGGNIDSVYPLGCELFRKRMECAVYLKCDEALSAGRGR